MSRQQQKTSKIKCNDSLLLMLLCFATEALVLFTTILIALFIGIKSDKYYLSVMIALCIGNLISGYISVRKTRKNGLYNGVLYSLPANIILIVLSVILNSFKIDYIIVINLILLIICSAIGGVLSVNLKQKTKLKTKTKSKSR